MLQAQTDVVALDEVGAGRAHGWVPGVEVGQEDTGSVDDAIAVVSCLDEVESVAALDHAGLNWVGRDLVDDLLGRRGRGPGAACLGSSAS